MYPLIIAYRSLTGIKILLTVILIASWCNQVSEAKQEAIL